MKAKRLLIILFTLLPYCTWAQISAVEKLGKEANKEKNVKYISISRTMIGMASAFADKEERATLKMLHNIDIITCENQEYAPRLTAQALDIAQQVGAKLIGCEEDDKARSEVYAIEQNETISELLVLITDHNGGVALFAMSGKIPISRLADVAKLKPTKLE
ncbi:MAG: DUF4252 domain-containing protein [Rikenellaceae bacterium]|nr:DUF4252 domain-containing protein [Rikenellaceae bacterium]